MSEVLREALGFVSTEKKEEVIDPKAKGGKGKAAESTTVELFVGQDTSIYKDIATKII
jgi:hypothetical protein